MVEIVCLQKGNQCASLYCLPTASGSVSSYLELAAALAPDHAVYGVRISGRAQTEGLKRFTSVREMAETIAPELIAHHGGGPISLVGYSFGGHLALDLALQLERRGRPVSLLAIIDTMPSRMSFTRGFRIRHFLRYVGPWMTNIATRLVSDPQHRADYVSDSFRRLRRQYRSSDDKWFQDLPIQRKEFVWDNISHARTYRFEGRYRGTICLFRPTDVKYGSPFRTGQLPDFGWQHVTGADVRVMHIPGDHSSCLVGAQAVHLANELRREFKNCSVAEVVVTEETKQQAVT